MLSENSCYLGKQRRRDHARTKIIVMRESDDNKYPFDASSSCFLFYPKTILQLATHQHKFKVTIKVLVLKFFDDEF